ncbi:MAG: superoxide dismutase [Chloroflexi bacterium]|nr:superoxide dismutase [Chloroflexota bacterium]
MRFLALGSEVDISFPGMSREEAAALGRAEARRSWELYQSGVIREVQFRVDAHRSVILLEAPDEAAARDALATLPFVRAGVLSFEIVGLRPYDGWARLFAPEDGAGGS